MYIHEILWNGNILRTNLKSHMFILCSKVEEDVLNACEHFKVFSSFGGFSWHRMLE